MFDIARSPVLRVVARALVAVLVAAPVVGLVALFVDRDDVAKATVTTYSSGGTRYIVKQFVHTGSVQTWTVPRGVTAATVLVVGGGGGGGSRHAGGGGGGGVREASLTGLSSGAQYDVYVGAGGAGAPGGGGSLTGGDGEQSYFLTGGSGPSASGGKGGKNSDRRGGDSGSSTDHGVNGGGAGLGDGTCSNGNWCGGGGGGAGSAGANADALVTDKRGGDGGSGRTSSISGTNLAYSGGGGGSSGISTSTGGTRTAGGSGGSSVGGSGGSSQSLNNCERATAGTSGLAHRGGGGGGGGYSNYSCASGTDYSAPGGAGGSGTVIVRYVMPGVSAPDLVAASDKGSSDSDNITNTSTPDFTGTAPVGSSIQLQRSVDGTTWSNTGNTCPADSNTGVWTCRTGSLAAGTYSIQAVSTTTLNERITQTSTSLSNVTIDTTVPSVSSFTSAQSSPTNASSFTYTLTFSENVSGVVSGDFSNAGTATNCSFAPGTDSGSSRTVTVSNCGEGTVIPRFAANGATDVAGNTGPSAAVDASTTITRDTTAPASSGSIVVTHTNSSSVSVNYSATDGVDVASVEVFRSTNSNLSGAVSCGSVTGLSATSVSGSVTCSGLSTDGTHYVYTRATDRAGNTETAPVNADDSVIRDTIVPSVESFTSAESSPTNASSFTYTLTFSENVSGVVSGDFSNAGTATNCSFAPGTDSGSSRTVTVSNCGEGTVIPRFAANGATDVAGNTGPSAAVDASTTITRDATAPSVSVSRSGSGVLGVGGSETLTFTLSEVSTDFVVGDVSVSGGSLSGFSGSGSSYSATFTPMAASEGTASVLVASGVFLDAAGNTNTVSNTLSIDYDTQRPSVSVSRSGSGVLGVGGSETLTFTLSEVSTDFVVGDVSVSGGSLSGFSGSGSSFSATFTPSSDAEGTASVLVASGVFSDAAGNTNTVSNTLSIDFDTQRPSVSSFTSSQSSPTNASTFTYTLTFSEDVSGVAAGDFRNAGTALNCSFDPGPDSGSSRMVTVSDCDDGTVIPSFASGGAKDTVENTGPTSDSTATTTVERDSVVPVPPSSLALTSGSDTGSSDSDRITNDTTPTVTATVGETSGSVVFTTGSSTCMVHSVTSTSVSCTFSVLTAGVHSVTVTQTDTAGNVSTVSGPLEITIDTTPPASEGQIAPLHIKASSVTVSFWAGDDIGLASMTVFRSITGDLNDAVACGTASSLIGTATSGAVTCTDLDSDAVHLVFTRATDVAGNVEAVPSQEDDSFRRDTVAPEALPAPVLDAASDTGSSSIDRVTNDSTPTFSVTLTETTGAVAFTATGPVTSTCEITSVSSATEWCTFSSLVDGNYSVTVAQTDYAGNTSVGSPTTSLVIDTAPPTVVIQAPNSPSGSMVYELSGSGGERLLGMDRADFTVTAGCVVQNPTDYTTKWTIQLTNCPNGPVSLTLRSETITDVAGNANASDVQASTVVHDGIAPSIDSFTADGLTYTTRSVSYSLTFSESVIGLTGSDFSNVGTAGICTFTSNASTGSTFTITATCPQDGTVIARLAANAVRDAAFWYGPASAADSPTITIVTGPTSLAVTTAPNGAASGVAFSTQPVVELRDANDQAVTGTAAIVSAVVTQVNSTGILVGTSTVSVDTRTGRATFSNLGLTGTAGTTYTVEFSSTVNARVLASATITVEVEVGPAARLAVITQPVGDSAGAALSVQPVVHVQDSGGNLVATSADSVTVSASGGTLGGTTTFNASSGVATFSDLTFAGTAGVNYTLSFSSASLTQTTSSNFSVTVGAPTKIVLTTTATGARYSEAFTTQPVVEIQDAGSNRVATSAVVTATLSGGVVVGTNQPSLSVNAVDGVATFSGLGIEAVPGPFSISYSSPGLVGTSQGVNLQRALQTISFTDPLDVTYSASAIDLTATATSGLAVTFSSATPTRCSVSGNEVTMLSSGTCRIEADQSGDTYYEPASTVEQSFVISKAVPTFTWIDVTKTFGDSPFAATEPGASVDGSFTYSSSDPTVVSVSGDILTVVGGGSATISATFTPDDTGKYESGGVVTMVVAVDRATQQPVTLTSTSGTYGDAIELAVQGGDTNGALTFEVKSGGTASGCVEAAGYLTSTSKGTCVVVATMAADRNYLSVTTPETTVTFDARPVTVSAVPETREYGENDPPLTYVTDRPLVVGDSLSGSLTRDSGEDVGSYTIRRGTLNNTDYLITFDTAEFEITRRSIVVTAVAVSKYYGDTDPDPTYSVPDGSLVFDDSLVGALDRATGENVGDFAIGAGSLTNANNPNYDITFESRDLTIERRPVVVTAQAKTKKYSTVDPPLTYTSSNVVLGETLFGALDRALGEDVGDYAIGPGTLTDANNPNYTITFVGANLDIYARPITVTADPKQITYGDPDPAFTYVIGGDGLKQGDVLSGSLARVVGANAGQHVITQGTLANANYSIEFVGALLTIEPKHITVTADDITITYGDPEPSLTLAAGPNDLVGNDQLNGSPVRESGSDAGPYAITQGSVTSANNPNYDITFVPGTLTIQRAAQAPLVIVQSTKVYGVDLTLTYTGGSGDGVATFSVSDPGAADCSLSGAALSATGGVGTTCSVLLTKASSTNFLEASTSASITVQPRQVTVSANSPVKFYGDPDPDLTYIVTSGTLVDGDSLSGGLTRSPGETPGTYAITQGTLGHPDYLIEVVPGTLTIDPRPITVTADDLSKTVGDLDPGLTFSVTAGTLITGDQFSGVLGRSPGELIGSYAITQGSLDHPSYDIDFVPGVLTINGISQSAMTLISDANPILRGGGANLLVTGGDGAGVVSFSILSESPVGACELATGASSVSAVVTGVRAGSCSVLAERASDGTYEAAQSQVLTITVNRQPQTIAFASPGDQDYSPDPFLVSPSSDSGLSVGLLSTTTSVCTVDGFLVRMLFRGVCELVASVGENPNYLDAVDVIVDFEVRAVPPTAPTISGLTATSDSIAVTFEAGDHGGEVISGYEYSLDAGTTWIALPVGSITSPIVISGTSASTQYGVMMRSVTVVGASPASNEMTVSTPAPPQLGFVGGGTSTTTTVVTTTTTTVVTTTTTLVTTTAAPSTTPSTTGVATTVVRTTVTETSSAGVERTTVTTQRAITAESSDDGSSTSSIRRDGSTSTPGGSDSSDGPTPPSTVMDLAPGKSVILRDGGMLDVNWSLLETGGATTSWGDVLLEVAASNGDDVDPLLDDGTLAIEQGSSIRVDASGLLESSPVEGWLYSEPTLLGVRSADDSGRLVTTFDVPRSIDVGSHTFELVVTERDGVVTRVAVGVMVLDAPAAAANRSGDLSTDAARLLVAPTVIGFVDLDPADSSMVALWLLLILVLVTSVGRLTLIVPRRGIPDFVSVVVDDASWLSGHRLVRWFLPICGFVLGAWASANTDAVPVPPATLPMLATLLIGILDPFSGLVAGATYATGVIVGGGLTSWSAVMSLLVVVALWSAPGLAGSAVSYIVTKRWWIAPAVVRASVATTLMVALVKNLPVHTSVETTTNLYVTEFAWLLAVTSLARSWLDHSVTPGRTEARRPPSRNRVMTMIGLAVVTFKFTEPDVRTVWTLTAVLTLIAVVLWRLRAESSFRSSSSAGRFAVCAVLIVGVTALGRGEPIMDRIESSDPIRTAMTSGTLLDDVMVDVDAYPYVFESAALPDHRIIVMNEDLGVHLTFSSVLLDGVVLPIDGNGLVLVAGQSVQIGGEGLEAGSMIDTRLFSTPQQLGVGQATSQGQIDATFPVPDDQPLGSHDLRIRVTLANGQTALVTLPVLVVATAPGQSF